MLWGLVKLAFKGLIGAFTGGSLEGILKTIDKGMSDDVEKEKVKADVTKVWIDRQASLLVGRTWWFQLFFVIPLGFWFSSVIFVSVFNGLGWTVLALPDPLNDWASWIISALFIVDGSKAILGRLGK